MTSTVTVPWVRLPVYIFAMTPPVGILPIQKGLLLLLVRRHPRKTTLLPAIAERSPPLCVRPAGIAFPSLSCPERESAMGLPDRAFPLPVWQLVLSDELTR